MMHRKAKEILNCMNIRGSFNNCRKLEDLADPTQDVYRFVIRNGDFGQRHRCLTQLTLKYERSFNVFHSICPRRCRNVIMFWNIIHWSLMI